MYKTKFDVLKNKTVIDIDESVINRIIYIVQDKENNKEYYWLDADTTFYGIALPKLHLMSEAEALQYLNESKKQ